MRIEVTQAHINRGERCQPGKCPIALAVKGATLEDDVLVVVGVHVGEGHSSYRLPEYALEWRRRFDTLGPAAVQPFGFDLPIESPNPDVVTVGETMYDFTELEDDYCEDCGRNMTLGEPHTTECEIALEQDREDGTL